MRKTTKKLIYSAFFLSLAYVLPFVTGQVPTIGQMLCPMHIPVILCGFLCGGGWGLLVGLTSPVLRALTIGMPPLFPSAIAMALELSVYGLVCGLLYKRLPSRIYSVYISLLTSMVSGRLAWGAIMLVISQIQKTEFSLKMFWTSVFLSSIPGIILQIVLIPVVVISLKRITSQAEK